jgi:drug/metabolite transporter superfamily protein YnfA
MDDTAGSVSRPSAGRCLAGVAAGFVALVLLGYPILMTALLAYSSFSGCFLECRAPQPGRGVVWSLVGAGLLAVPVFLGLSVARVRSGRVRLSAGALVALVVVGWAVLSLLA